MPCLVAFRALKYLDLSSTSGTVARDTLSLLAHNNIQDQGQDQDHDMVPRDAACPRLELINVENCNGCGYRDKIHLSVHVAYNQSSAGGLIINRNHRPQTRVLYLGSHGVMGLSL